MKRLISYSALLLATVIATTFFDSCKKEEEDDPAPIIINNNNNNNNNNNGNDSIAPVITITNDDAAHNRVEQFSFTTYPDPGATATDNTDPNPTVNTSGTVDMNLAGDYTITYTATDSTGNSSSAYRPVCVDGGYFLAGSYSVEDFTGVTSNGTYIETITSDVFTCNIIHFTKFGMYTNATIYGTVSGTTITIPSQTIYCGSPAANRTFIGSGTFTNNFTTMTINYDETTGGTTIYGHGLYARNK